ncbi:MAG: hypothetical protein GKS06_19840 [Acidobacteria bacterium]|nr:hypothetical protein [Acidobacteriota bacterium]
MRARPVRPAVAFALVVLSSVSLAQRSVRRAWGPHDAARADFDAEEFWLPRHHIVLERSRLQYPAVALPPHRAAKLKFKQPKRISTDVLDAPPASLPTAQAETQTEPYVAVNPENDKHLVAGWQETRFTDGGARSLGVAVSRNGGRRWTDALIPGLAVADGGEWNRASDPWPAFGPDGVVYFNSLLVGDGQGNGPLGSSAIAVSVSRDGGSTWGEPVLLARDKFDFHDKNSMVVDTVAGSRHRGNAYVAWDINLLRPGTGGQRMVWSRSTDEGLTWSKPKRIAEGGTNIGVILRVGPDGTLYAIWAGASAGDANLSLRLAKSTNGGRSFGKVTTISDFLAAGVAGYRAGAILPSFDIDPTTGDLFVVFPDARFTGVDQAALIVSRDGGDTWSAPARVNDGPASSPAMTVGVTTNQAGHVLVGYYTLRNDKGPGTMLDYYVNRSTDGGATFEKGVRVTRKSFDATEAAKAGGALSIFLGDYVGLAGGTKSFFAVFTAPLKASKLGPGRQPDIFGAVAR